MSSGVIDEEAGANVAKVAVGGGGGAPILSNRGTKLWVGRLVFGWIEGLDDRELGLIEFGKLGLQPGVAGVNGGASGCGYEDGAFVGDVTVNGGELGEFARGVEVESIILDKVMVEGRVVGEQSIGFRVREVIADILRLEGGDIETAEAGESIFAAGTISAIYEGVVLILRLGDGAECAERLGFRDGADEEIVIATTVGGELHSNAATTCRITADDDVLRIPTELGDVVMDPLQCHALILEPVVEATMVMNFSAGKKAVGADAIIDRYDDDLVARGLDQATAILSWVGSIEPTTLDEKIDRERRCRCNITWGINVKIQAVFAGATRLEGIIERVAGPKTVCTTLHNTVSTNLKTHGRATKLTSVTICKVEFAVTFWGSANRRFPNGGWAYRTPNHWLIPPG